MMQDFYLIFATVLLGILAVSIAFVTRRKGGAESFLAALLIGTTGVAITLLVGFALKIPRVVDAALVLALLAAVLGAAFSLRAWPGDTEDLK